MQESCVIQVCVFLQTRNDRFTFTPTASVRIVNADYIDTEILPDTSVSLYRIAGKLIFVGLNFCYQALKSYFRGLIFVVCPEHFITIAYCPRLLFDCPDFQVNLPFWGSP